MPLEPCSRNNDKELRKLLPTRRSELIICPLRTKPLCVWTRTEPRMTRLEKEGWGRQPGLFSHSHFMNTLSVMHLIVKMRRGAKRL